MVVSRLTVLICWWGFPFLNLPLGKTKDIATKPLFEDKKKRNTFNFLLLYYFNEFLFVYPNKGNNTPHFLANLLAVSFEAARAGVTQRSKGD